MLACGMCGGVIEVAVAGGVATAVSYLIATIHDYVRKPETTDQDTEADGVICESVR